MNAKAVKTTSNIFMCEENKIKSQLGFFLFTQIHFSSAVQFVKYIIFQIINKPDFKTNQKGSIRL